MVPSTQGEKKKKSFSMFQGATFFIFFMTPHESQVNAWPILKAPGLRNHNSNVHLLEYKVALPFIEL